MKIVFMGPPGGGKGTQAQLLSEKLGVPHISTGSILLENIRNNSPLGKRVKQYYEKGQLAPDELIISLVRERLAYGDCSLGFIIEGFPRNLNQAEALDQFENIDRVINLQVPEQELIKRMSGRRVCECGAFYNMNIPSLRPKKPEVCDQCGRKLIQRPDDKEAAIRERLRVYNTQVKPVIEYYKKKGILRDVDGSPDVERVAEAVFAALK